VSVHPDVTPLEFLLGSWKGSGHGEYPTIESFDYFEEVSFVAPPGKPFVVYTQKTRHADDDRPLHTETGYLRPVGDGTVEMTLAQPTGVVEIHVGTVSAGRLELTTHQVGLTPTAKEVTSVRRELAVDGDTLTYDLAMAAVGRPITHHLHAVLHRI